MQDLNAIHKRFCPTKCMSNFWLSKDYAAVKESLSEVEIHRAGGHRGAQAQTMVHPVVALAFLRWADPVEFYKKLHMLAGDE